MRLFARSLVLAPLAALVPALFFACSSSSSTTGSTTSAAATTGSTTGAGGGGGAGNCVKVGTPNNAEGLGGYCTPDGGECGTSAICTASVPGVPTNAWFCTVPCTGTTDCGEGLSCITSKLGNLKGSGCVPTSCDFLAVTGTGGAGGAGGAAGTGGAGGSGVSACTSAGVGGAGGGTTAATGTGGAGGADGG